MVLFDAVCGVLALCAPAVRVNAWIRARAKAWARAMEERQEKKKREKKREKKENKGGGKGIAGRVWSSCLCCVRNGIDRHLLGFDDRKQSSIY